MHTTAKRTKEKFRRFLHGEVMKTCPTRGSATSRRKIFIFRSESNCLHGDYSGPPAFKNLTCRRLLDILRWFFWGGKGSHRVGEKRQTKLEDKKIEAYVLSTSQGVPWFSDKVCLSCDTTIALSSALGPQRHCGLLSIARRRSSRDGER